MSNERIAYHTPSPTLYDFLGMPDEEILGNPDDTHLAHEPDTSTPDSVIKQEAPTPANSSGAVNEDKAIQFLLQSLRPEQIVQCVKIHKDSKDAGNHAALDVISGVQTDELLRRIHTVEARLISTRPVHSTISAFAAVHTPTKLKREPSQDFDEKPVSSPQGDKRARTAFMEEELEPINAPEHAGMSETRDALGPVKTHRRGCPGNCWNCKPAELKPRTYWTSFKKFREHYQIHLEDHRVNGHRWQCRLCDHDSFGGNGHDLMQHLWDTHFK